MDGKEKAGFECPVCALLVVTSHVPPTTPNCPSCGAVTRPNESMKALAGDVRCMHCDHIEPAYTHRSCPICDTVFGTFAAGAARA